MPQRPTPARIFLTILVSIVAFGWSLAYAVSHHSAGAKIAVVVLLIAVWGVITSLIWFVKDWN